MAASWLTHAWQNARRAVGLEDVRFHDLRHGAISTWIRAGWSVKRVQVEAGHVDPAFTIRVYGFLFPDEIDHGRAQLDAAIATATADGGRIGPGPHADPPRLAAVTESDG